MDDSKNDPDKVIRASKLVKLNPSVAKIADGKTVLMAVLLRDNVKNRCG